MENPAASDNTFTHEPLPDPAKYIRLLEVLDDKYSKTIKVRCRLTTWPIDSAPSYHAISYMWGDPKSNTLILMNGKTLQVRTNCEFALKQAYWYKRSQSFWYRKLRSRWYEKNKSEWYSKSRYFWLDAICIDQASLGEKSKQVAMMGSIYKKASHVLACIGDHADDSLFLFQSLYGPAHYVVRPKDMLRYDKFGAFGVHVRFLLFHRYSTTHRFVLALARMAVRPYFTRMWILQELVHAQNITILCGDYVLPKDDAIYLFRGIWDSRARSDDPETFETTLRRMIPWISWYAMGRGGPSDPATVWRRDWIDGLKRRCEATLAMLQRDYMAVKDHPFGLLSEVVCDLQCQDPRDKVYGIISLIDWGNIAPLEPDYTYSDLEAAVRFIEAIMKLEAQRTSEPIWRYVNITVELLNLNAGSRGLAEALEARRGGPQDCTEGASMTPIGDSSMRLRQPCWRLSSDDIDKSNSHLQNLQATPPQYPRDDALFLPRWARANDWVIKPDIADGRPFWYDPFRANSRRATTYRTLLLMREGQNGRRNALIGYGFIFSAPLKGSQISDLFKYEEDANVDICFTIEDAIIVYWKMQQLHGLHPDSKDRMVGFLDTGVCRQQMLGSSYAILAPDLPVNSKTARYRELYNTEFEESLLDLRLRKYILWDTKDRRGWLVNGTVAALQLLLAYIRNTPQGEIFDFTRIHHIDNKTPEAAWEILCDEGNMNIIIHKVLEDVDEKPRSAESSLDLANIEQKSLGEVMKGIYDVMRDLKPRSPMLFKDRWDLMGWDFERIYRTNKAKLYKHKFDEEPSWLSFAKDLEPIFLFGSDFGEIMQPREGHCCPYFKTVPKGQDYLVMDMHMIKSLMRSFRHREEKSEIVARLTLDFAWEHRVDPFRHSHGQDDHLDKVDSSCFPVQKIVKTPKHDWQTPEREEALLKEGEGRRYSWQDVAEMTMTVSDTDEAVDENGESQRPSEGEMIVVLGNYPDREKLRQLAEANL